MGPEALASCDSFSPDPCPAAGDALLDAGESMKRLAEVKDSLDIEVKQNFIDPLQNLCDKDLKEIQVLRTPMPHPACLPSHSPQGRCLTAPLPHLSAPPSVPVLLQTPACTSQL